MTERMVSLTPGKRVLFLTKDPDLIRRQLQGTLDLRMDDLRVEDLLDDVNTDAMTPAWACFDYRPEDIARNAYAGITVGKERLFPQDALKNGNFEVIVSGYRKGVGLIARDGRAGREVVGDPDRHRRLLRAHPRPQQHQPGRADGGSRDPEAPPGRRERPPLRVREGLGPDHAHGDRARGALPVHEGLRGGQGDPAGTRHPEAAHEHRGEDPGRARGRGEGPRVREAGRRGVRARGRRVLARVHHRPGPLLPRAGARSRLHGGQPGEVRRLRRPPHLCGRRGEDGALLAEDPGVAGHAARVPEARRACRTTRRRAASRRGSATPSPASGSSSPATSSRPRTATRAWAGPRTPSPTGSAPRSTPRS